MSVAWVQQTGYDGSALPNQSQIDNDGHCPAHTVEWEVVTDSRHAPLPASSALIASAAWPFAQGEAGKPEERPQQQMTIPVTADEWSSWDAGDDDSASNLPLTEWVALLKWLRLVGKHGGLVFHNAKFDLQILLAGPHDISSRHQERRWRGEDFSGHVVWDTQLANAIMWPVATDPATHQRTTSLKPTASRLWGSQTTDEQKFVKDYLRKNKLPAGRWDLMPWDVISDYAEHDARLTIRLCLFQEAELAYYADRDLNHGVQRVPDVDYISQIRHELGTDP